MLVFIFDPVHKLSSLRKKQFSMKGSFAKRSVITVCFLLIIQEVNPLVLKRAGKNKISSDLDGEVRLKLVNGQSKRFIENEKGKAAGYDVASYEQGAQEKRAGKFFHRFKKFILYLRILIEKTHPGIKL